MGNRDHDGARGGDVAMDLSSSTLVWASATFAVMALFFIWGFAVARARGRSGIMWGLACALTLVVGLAILYSLGDKVPSLSRDRRASLDDDDLADGQHEDPDDHLTEIAVESVASAGGGSRFAENPDDRRWRYLAEYHPDVRKAVSAVSLLGEPALGELKAAHLALNDPALLPAIVQRLGERYSQSPPSKRNGAAKISPPAEAQAGGVPRDADDDDPLILDKALAKPEPVWQPAAIQARGGSPAIEPVSVLSATKTVAAPASNPAVSRNPGGERLAQPAPSSVATATIGVAHEASDQNGDSVEFVDDDDDTEDITAPDAPGETTGPAVPGKPTNGIAAPAFVAAEVPPAGPERKQVTPADLQGARFLETRAGVHLFGLVDGRVFVDRHEARGSLKLAREFVDQLPSRRAGA